MAVLRPEQPVRFGVAVDPQQVAFLAVDVETVALRADEVPSAVVEYLLGGRSSLTALHPAFGRVVCVAFSDPTGAVESRTALSPQGEGELLEFFWDRLEASAGAKLVTWNGRRFDIPFVQVRSLVRGVRWKVELDLRGSRPLQETNLIDLMELFAPGLAEFRWIPQELAAHLLGIEVAPAPAGRDIESLVRDGDADGVRRRCERDARLTAELFLRVRALLPFGVRDPASPRQLDYLRQLLSRRGQPVDEKWLAGLSRAEASAEIDRLQNP